MSVSQAFANLSNSIRAIREDKRRHEERMGQLQLQNKQLEYEMNDPRTQKERIMAQREMELVSVRSPKFSTEGKSQKQIDMWKNYILPSMRESLESQYGLTDNGTFTQAGGSEEIKVPRFIAREIEETLQIAAASASLDSNKLDMDIAMAYEKKADLEAKIKAGANSVTNQKDLGIVTRRIKNLETERDDDDHRVTRMINENRSLNQFIRKISRMQNPNTKLMAQLNDMIENNNQTIKLYKDSGNDTAAKLTTIKYYNPANGSVITREIPKGSVPRPVTEGPDGTYIEGTGPKNKSDSGGMTVSFVKRTIEDVRDALIVIDTANIGLEQEEDILERLKSNGVTSPDKAEKLAKYIKTSAGTAVEEKINQLEDWQKQWGHTNWFPKVNIEALRNKYGVKKKKTSKTGGLILPDVSEGKEGDRLDIFD